MSQEYWLQKKTIGGWSMVTWYAELEQAQLNYAKCVGKGDSGYSWRLIEAKTINEDMLNDVVNVEAPVIEQQPLKQASWGRPAELLIQDKAGGSKTSGWGQPASGWGKPTSIDPKPAVFDLPADSERPSHGGAGKVCMINHTLKQRTKVDANAVDDMIAQGWIRGGPRTEFKSV